MGRKLESWGLRALLADFFVSCHNMLLGAWRFAYRLALRLVRLAVVSAYCWKVKSRVAHASKEQKHRVYNNIGICSRLRLETSDSE
jgi:hypothetical protein